MRKVLHRTANAIDIGAHRGTILREILHRAPAGEHHAFEPVPVYAARLRARFPQVAVHEVALSDHEGEARFIHVLGNPGMSSFHPHKS
jgi:FkbM family methyltransferase